MRSVLFRLTPLLLLTATVFLTSCESPEIAAQIEARRAQIAAEPLGDYYIGRRFVIERTHFWGYLRRPRQSWDSSKLVVFNEKQCRTPDRLPEMPSGDGRAFGYDHNQEYRIWGFYSGRKIYDPNSNLFLPEFVLQRYELINPSPGWLFSPKDKFNGYQLLRSEPEAMPR